MEESQTPLKPTNIGAIETAEGVAVLGYTSNLIGKGVFRVCRANVYEARSSRVGVAVDG